jgi:arylsulfatase A-like enzyme
MSRQIGYNTTEYCEFLIMGVSPVQCIARPLILARYGVSYGVLLGLVDLAVRVFNMHFEWFELYLSLLLPILVFASLFLLIGIVRELWFLSGLPGQKIFSNNTVLGACLFGLLVFLYGLGVIVTTSSATSTLELLIEAAGPVLLVLAVVVLVLRNTEKFIALVDRLAKSAIANIFQSSVAFALGIIALSLPMDLYQMYSIPSSSPLVTPDKGLPNIVLITLDTVRADRMSVYDPSRKTTPNLKKLSESAAVFEDAISSSSWTLPGHAGMFTGKTLSQHGAHANHQVLTHDQTTLAEHLSGHGYVTAGFVSGPYCKAKYGLGQGFQVYKDRLDFFEWNTTFDRFSIRRLLMKIFPGLWGAVFQATGERTAPEINRDALTWLDRREDSSPFFMFLNYYDAHDPYVLGEKYLHKFTKEKRSYDEVDAVLDSIYYGGPRRFEFKTVSDDLRRYMLALYDSEIYHLDFHIGKLMEALRERGLLQNTIFVVTSDHGEEFFEHGGVLHRQTLFREVLEVPLLIFGPGVTARRVDTLVGTQQIYSTVLELAGVASGASDSLVPHLHGKAEAEAGAILVLSELYGNRALGAVDIVSLTTPKWKFIDVSEERGRLTSGLYQRDLDREEKRSVLADEEEQVQILTEAIEKKVGEKSWVKSRD